MNSFTEDEKENIENELGKFEIKDYTHYNLLVLETEDGKEYAVGDDKEADDAWEESLDDYIDECILPEIPEQYQFYFDDKRWKNDAKMDGRGHSLAVYDGDELDIGDLVQ